MMNVNTFGLYLASAYETDKFWCHTHSEFWKARQLVDCKFFIASPLDSHQWPALKPSHMQKKVVQWFHVHKEKWPKTWLLYLRLRCVASQQIGSKILKKDQYFVLGSYQGLPCKIRSKNFPECTDYHIQSSTHNINSKAAMR